MWSRALVNAREQADKTLSEVGMKVDSVFAVSPVSFASISSSIFSNEATAERVVVVGSYIPTGESAKPPSRFQLAPIEVTQKAHVIYLISPAK